MGLVAILVTSVLDRHAPIKSKRVRRERQPEWYNNDINEASRKRDTYHNKKNWSQYKYWRNKTNTLIRKSKSEFFSNAIKDNKTNSFLWKHVKKLGNNTEPSSIPEELIVDDETYKSPSDIMNKLNSYFANISDRLRATEKDSSIPESCDFKIRKLCKLANSREH